MDKSTHGSEPVRNEQTGIPTHLQNMPSIHCTAIAIEVLREKLEDLDRDYDNPTDDYNTYMVWQENKNTISKSIELLTKK